MLNNLVAAGYDLAIRNHAEAILSFDFADEFGELLAAILSYRIRTEEILRGGGGESGQTQRLRHELDALAWEKHKFSIDLTVDGRTRESISHEVDHVRFGSKGALALEIEWNNKDPFFDRDLENFQRLHALSAISVGIIVTRGRSMQDTMLDRVSAWLRNNGLNSEEDLERLGLAGRTPAQRRAVAQQVARGVPFVEAFARKFTSDKFGQATTHWAKLEDRINRGVGNPCPLLLIGLPDTIIVD